MSPPEYSALDQQALLSEDPDGCENRNSILIGHIQNVICSRIQGRSNNLKGTSDQTHLLVWRGSKRGMRQLEDLLIQTLGIHLGSSFYHLNTGAGSCRLLTLTQPSNLLTLGTMPQATTGPGDNEVSIISIDTSSRNLKIPQSAVS